MIMPAVENKENSTAYN